MRSALAAGLAGWLLAGGLTAGPAVAASSSAPGSVVSPLAPSRLAPRALALATEARLAEAEAAAPAQESRGRGRLEDVGRSLVLPGWGQLHAGHRTLGFAFLAAEAAIWTAFAINVVKGEHRQDTYEETALLFAGIDLEQVDEHFRSLVGQYESSDEYNRLVVYRDAAALYYGDFENYNRYIEENSVRGDEAWAWATPEKFAQYGAERRSSENSFHDARTVAALAVVNRVASAIVAARMAPVASEAEASSDLSSRPTLGFHFDERGRPEPRLAWELRFH